MRLNFGHVAANAWARGFLRNCRRELRGRVPDTGRTAAAIARTAQAVFDEGAADLPDRKAKVIRTLCSLVLAAARELRPALGPDAAFDTVRRAFGATFRGPVLLVVRAWLWLSRDPVRSLARVSLAAVGRKQYGASMEFDEARTADAYELIVRRCAFHQFFLDHGAPELTPLICAWDRAWMDVIDGSARPVRTERPSTISTGGACCRFRLVRDGAERPAGSDDVILVTLGTDRVSAGKE
jgi:hypothetical protein